MGHQLSTGSCRHRWLPGPAPSPPGKQAAFPQPRSLKPNPSFQLQLQRAWGLALPGDPAACRSHGQGIFPVRCSRRAEPSEQRAERARRLSSPSPFSSTRPSAGKGKPIKSRPPLRSGANKGLENRNQQHPGGTGSRSFWSSFPFFQLCSLRRKLTCTLPGCTVSNILKSTRGWRRGHSLGLQGVRLSWFQCPRETLFIKEQSNRGLGVAPEELSQSLVAGLTL